MRKMCGLCDHPVKLHREGYFDDTKQCSLCKSYKAGPCHGGGQPLTVVSYAEAVESEGIEYEELGNGMACVSGVCGS